MQYKKKNLQMLHENCPFYTAVLEIREMWPIYLSDCYFWCCLNKIIVCHTLTSGPNLAVDTLFSFNPV